MYVFKPKYDISMSTIYSYFGCTTQAHVLQVSVLNVLVDGIVILLHQIKRYTPRKNRTNL